MSDNGPQNVEDDLEKNLEKIEKEEMIVTKKIKAKTAAAVEQAERDKATDSDDAINKKFKKVNAEIQNQPDSPKENAAKEFAKDQIEKADARKEEEAAKKDENLAKANEANEAKQDLDVAERIRDEVERKLQAHEN